MADRDDVGCRAQHPVLAVPPDSSPHRAFSRLKGSRCGICNPNACSARIVRLEPFARRALDDALFAAAGLGPEMLGVLVVHTPGRRARQVASTAWSRRCLNEQPTAASTRFRDDPSAPARGGRQLHIPRPPAGSRWLEATSRSRRRARAGANTAGSSCSSGPTRSSSSAASASTSSSHPQVMCASLGDRKPKRSGSPSISGRRRNSIRRTKVPRVERVARELVKRVSSAFYSIRKRDTAATIPGRSGHEMARRMTPSERLIARGIVGASPLCCSPPRGPSKRAWSRCARCPTSPTSHLRPTGDGEQEVVLALPLRRPPGRGRAHAAGPPLRLGPARVVGAGRRLGRGQARRDPAPPPRADAAPTSSTSGSPRREQRWVGHVRTTRYDGRGWFALDTLAGTPPEALGRARSSSTAAGWCRSPKAAASALPRLRDPRLSIGARRCLEALEYGEQPPAARLILTRGVAGERFTLETFWDPEISGRLRAAAGRRAPTSSSSTPGSSTSSTRSSRCTRSRSQPPAATALAELAAEQRAPRSGRSPLARDHRRAAGSRSPRGSVAASSRRSSGSPCATRSRPAARFLSDEQGLGKTVEALAALEADDAFPAVVVCPASMKLTWAREAARWLPHRSREVSERPRGRPIGAGRHHDPQLRDRPGASAGARGQRAASAGGR